MEWVGGCCAHVRLIKSWEQMSEPRLTFSNKFAHLKVFQYHGLLSRWSTYRAWIGIETDRYNEIRN